MVQVLHFQMASFRSIHLGLFSYVHVLSVIVLKVHVHVIVCILMHWPGSN